MILSTSEKIMYRTIVVVLLLLIAIGMYPNLKQGLTQIGSDVDYLVGDHRATPAPATPVAPSPSPR